METITLPALELKQDGTSLIVTKMKAGDLKKYTRIEHFSDNKPLDAEDQGYQRRPEGPRIKKFANWLRKEKNNGGSVRMPTAILLSARGTDLVLSPSGTITLRSSTPLPLVDGQHRSEGFAYAIDKKGLIEFGNYEIPVIIMLNVDKTTEMMQFRIVNGEQKSVRTDLVNMILTQLAAVQGDEAVDDRDHWKVIASIVVKELNNASDSPWKDKIVMPDQRAYSAAEVKEDKALRHLRVARATSYMTALKPVIGYFDTISTTDKDLNARAREIASALLNFWTALSEEMPQCFSEADDYVLQKTPGIFSVTRFALNLMKVMYKAQVDFEKKEFAKRIRSCTELCDPEYWNADGGDASKYGSMKGFKELGDLLWSSYEDASHI